MAEAAGLYGHIRRNMWISRGIIAGFAMMVCACWISMAASYSLTMSTFMPGLHRSVGELPRVRIVDGVARMVRPSPVERAVRAAQGSLQTLHYPLGFVGLWLLLVWASPRTIMQWAMGSTQVSRKEQPKLYNTVETLAIAAGTPMPRVEILETPALNAYAYGLDPEHATIGVTRGLIEKLPQRELEAVLAHELTHILNRDSRVMTMASVLAGVFEKLVHDAWRLLSLPFSGSKRRMMALPWMIMPLLLAASALPPLLFFWGLVAVSRASLSRAREFLADAGAVELTKDPDALISALRRIASSDEIVDAPAAMQAMMIFGRFAGLMATHPPLEERIEALRQHAGAYNPEPITREIRAAAVGAGARTFGRRKMAGPPRLQRG